MKIFNTYSQKLELLDLKTPIGIYVCGVTPYDTTHLGHAFTFITYDVLVRFLKFLGANLTYVQNVTDIDDDILIKSKSLGISWKKLGQSEGKKHLQSMDALNALRPDNFPKASENIEEMIKIIKVLVLKNFAYVRNNSVYFNVKSDKNFGKLSRYGYPAMLEIANDRGNFPLDPNKINQLDFVLWQAQRPGEPFWNSPWGKGRPGWHIECSAMSLKYLGKTITLHGGGEDLIFPHHEAEIAQSENYTNQRFVKIWMHTSMVYCGRHKMSKSLGNMVFINDLLKKYAPNAIRILLLSHYYRKPWNYEESEFKKAQESAKILEKASVKTKAVKFDAAFEKLPGFFRAIDNDFNVPKALKLLILYAQSKDSKPEIINTCRGILGLV